MRIVIELSEFDLQNVYSSLGKDISEDRARQLLKSRRLRELLQMEIQDIVEYAVGPEAAEINSDTASDELMEFSARDDKSEI